MSCEYTSNDEAVLKQITMSRLKLSELYNSLINNRQGRKRELSHCSELSSSTIIVVIVVVIIICCLRFFPISRLFPNWFLSSAFSTVYHRRSLSPQRQEKDCAKNEMSTAFLVSCIQTKIINTAHQQIHLHRHLTSPHLIIHYPKQLHPVYFCCLNIFSNRLLHFLLGLLLLEI